MAWLTTRAVLLLMSVSSLVVALFDTEDLPLTAYSRPGDINLGILLVVHEPEKGRPCSGDISIARFMLIESIVFTVEKINNNSDILPNTTLGFVILDDCNTPATSLTQASKFVPLAPCMLDHCRKGSSHFSEHHYDVVGVIGPTTSPKATLVSPILSQHKIPHLSFGTSSVFSNKDNYKYFSRIVPPDQYQAEAIMDLVHHYNWTYISILYIEGSYGYTAMKDMEKRTKVLDICIAYVREVSRTADEREYDNIIYHLRENKNAKVVIAFLGTYEKFFEAVVRNDAVGEFIFIGGESFDLRSIRGNEASAVGTFSYMIPQGRSDSFRKFYSKRGPVKHEPNPWIEEFWEDMFGCSFENNSTKKKCEEYPTALSYPQFFFRGDTPVVMDSVNVFAYALDDVIKRSCSGSDTYPGNLTECVRQADLLSAVRKTKFVGESGPVEMDDKGDLIGSYLIKQVIVTDNGYDHVTVGTWKRSTRQSEVEEDLVQWQMRYRGHVNGTSHVPESVCAWPCKTGEFRIQGELKCCWECRRCRENEIVRPDKQGCDICPTNTWPDPETFTECRDIPPKYLVWLADYGLGLTIMALCGLIGTLCACAVFIWYRDHKAIKGSSREQMAIIFVGMMMSYITIFLSVAMPRDATCIVNFAGFHLSVSLMFVPLFVKSLRIYRIFMAAEKCQRPEIGISAISCIVQTAALLATMVALLVCAVLIFRPSAVIQMPVITEPYTELYCRMKLEALLIPLIFNLLILLICAIFGFLARKLPDNFNESWYIFLSVAVTLFVWIAFLPTYFLAFFAYHKAALLSLALFLNATAVLLCMICPKIYAVYFIPLDQIKVSSFKFSESSSTTSGTGKPTLSSPSSSASGTGVKATARI